MKIDWSQIPEGFDWVAVDYDGTAYAYKEEPPLRGSYAWSWSDQGFNFINVTSCIEGSVPDWRMSLRKRGE